MSDMVRLTDDLIETALLADPNPNGTHTQPRNSWTPINLNTLPDQPPIRPTLGGVGIVYPGKRHVFSGPPESAKTLCAYAIAILVAHHGGTVILLDFEMGGYDARARLRELGATHEHIDRIPYIEPDEKASDEHIQNLIKLSPDLVIVDATAGAYDLEGLDDNKRTDVEKFSRLYVTGFWRANIATILIDHVVKDIEGRGRWVIGSERKLGGADVHFGFETVRPISRGGSGLYKIITHKDRGGWLKRGRLADLELSSDPETNQIDWAFLTPETEDDEGNFRPTYLMEKVSRYLELQTEPVSRNSVHDTLGGRKKFILQAIQVLVDEGFAATLDVPGGSKPVASVRPYREDDPTCNPEKRQSGSPVPGGSRPVPGTGVVSGSRGSAPYGAVPVVPPHSDHPSEGQWFRDLAYLESLAPDPDPDDPIPWPQDS